MARRQTRGGTLVALLAVVLVLVIAPTMPALAATTTQETGPLTKHAPQTYVYDLSTSVLTNEGTGEHIAYGFDNGKCPILLPGDTVRLIPEPNVLNGNMAKGFILADNSHYPGAKNYESRGPIEVTKTEIWGGKYYITEFAIVGECPVCVWSNGGGDYSSQELADGDTYVYRQGTLDFMYYTDWVNVSYQYWYDKTGASLTDEQLASAAFYTSDENPTVFFAEDALVNRYAESNETLGLTVHRPYIEGLRFYAGNAAWQNNSDVYDYRGAEWSTTDGTSTWDGDHGEIYPQWKGSGGSNQVLGGSYEDDYVVMRFMYTDGTTVTFDANGGTIDGYESRIYEFFHGITPFWIKVNDGSADEELAAGTAWTPVREGYVFCGWYTDAACTTPMGSFKDQFDEWDSDWPHSPSKAYHLYAKWKRQSSISLAPATQAYTGRPVSMASVAPAVVKGSSGEVSYEYFADEGCTEGVEPADVVALGTYWVRATVAEDDEWLAATSEAVALVVKPADIATAELTLSSTSYTYSGVVKRPTPTLTLGGATLVKGTDYVVAYQNNVNAGTATITLTGKGNYAGTKSANYTIKAKTITPTVKFSATTYTYSGKVKTPSVTVTYGDATLVKGTDYDVAYASGRVNAGTYKVTVKLKGNYSGSKTVSFRVAPKAVTPAVTLSSSRYVYSGSVRKPTVTVKVGSTKLTTASYTVSYATGRKLPGTYKVTVTLKGNYSGSKVASFRIVPKATTVSIVTAASKALTVTWAKQATQTSGYQLQWSTSSSFASGNKSVHVTSNKTTSKKLTGLSANKKYYVRVRTYKVVNGTKYYSAWSAKKAATTK